MVVTGDDRWAVEEALHLARHAGAVVLVSGGPPEAPADRLQMLAGLATVTLVEGRITALAGDEALERVTIETAAGARRTVDAKGLFLQSGRRPARGFLDPAQESRPGLLWAGDVRSGAERTIAEAIADGTRAGQNAARRVTSRRTS